MSSISPRNESVKTTQPRHEAVRGFPALHHFSLAESAVKEGRAEWLPMTSRHDEPDDDVAAVPTPYAPDDNPILDLPPGRDDDYGDYELDPPEWEEDGDDGRYDTGEWDETDDHVWNLGPEPVGPPELTMSERVLWEAERYRGWGTELGDLLAERMTVLADQFRLLDSNDPLTYRDRREAMLTDAVNSARQRLVAAGIEA